MINTAFTDLQSQFGIPSDVLQLLSDSGISPAIVERLLRTGILADDIAVYILDYGPSRGVALLELNHGFGYRVPNDLLAIFYDNRLDAATIRRLMAAGMPADEIALLLLDYGASGVEVLDKLVAVKIHPLVALDVVDLATQLAIFKEVRTLVNSGKLRHQAGFRKFLREVSEEAARGNFGKVRELRDAATRAAQGHEVQLGKVGDYGADVVDHTSREAIQHKLITTKDQLSTERHIRKAADQLAGLHGEIPPPGYTRIIDVEVTNPQNPLFDADREVVSTSTQDALIGKSAVDQVHFTNKRERYSFDAPDFN